MRLLGALTLAMLGLAAVGCGASTTAVHSTTEAPSTTAAPATTAVAPATTARPAAVKTGRRHLISTTRRVAPAAAARATAVPQPKVIWDPVPFGTKRKAEMSAYVGRHYSSIMKPTWRLVDPHVIVIHYTDASYSSTYSTFATDVPDSELHELPATSAHFVIDTNGAIHQLVSVGTMARHTVGLNWTALGIEHVGFSDGQVLGDHAQITASLRLVHSLQCRFHIQIRNVIGHAESLSSPFHHEDVPSPRTQTHGDFARADMNVYRRRLRALGGC
ncbi:MAG: N-acetylmuramoyl-L-alanine amidase [Solirubrobacteraceae bacterium]